MIEKRQCFHRKHSMPPLCVVTILIVLVVLLTSLAPPGFIHAENNVKKTGTFSNLTYHKESGDLLGVEIRIVYAKQGYQGTFQASEGEPDNLELINSIIFDGNSIRFAISSSSLYGGKFVGSITDANLSGTLTLNNGHKVLINLKRRGSYWD